MTVLTFFFCGTGSNSWDATHNPNYHEGELITTLAKNHAGMEFVDWIQVDGPGSGNLQQKQHWVNSPEYTFIRGTLEGKGWDENIKHAVAVVIGATEIDRQEFSKQETTQLRKMGVGVDRTIKTNNSWSNTALNAIGLGEKAPQPLPLRPRISPQALQQKKVSIFRKSSVTSINAIGWSRGAVTCQMFANALAEPMLNLDKIPVNIFLCDPVPGDLGFQESRITLQENVKNYVAIYAEDERSKGFSPILPTIPQGTSFFITTIPGRHGTLVGNAALDGNSGDHVLKEPGLVIRDMAEKYLTLWGTTLNNMKSFTDDDILKHYDKMLRDTKKYKNMRKVSYTGVTQNAVFTANDSRLVGRSDKSYVHMDAIPLLQPDPIFINSHHRKLFLNKFVSLNFQDQSLRCSREVYLKLKLMGAFQELPTGANLVP